MEKDFLDRLYEHGVLSHLDIHFANFMGRLTGQDVPEVSLAAALVSGYTRQGHICLDLSSLAGKALPEGDSDGVVCPALSDWRKKLIESSVVGKPGEYKPLILDERSRFYLHRYWDYQKRLTDSIKSRVRGDAENVDMMMLGQRLARHFPPGETEEIDWQKVAAFSALTRRFCVISGGPGTGKTSTVGKILALLLEQAGSEKLRIALAAPTGKAAARLHESIEHVREHLDSPDTIKEAIPTEASTIHRLLGSISDSPYFRHDDKHPLPIDAMVVDEASMADLALMSKLVQALPPQARLILLGDKDQLASVEAGAVLGDICDRGNVHGFSERFCVDLNKVTGYEIEADSDREREPGIQDCIVELQKSYRFERASGIGAVSQAVNAGNPDVAMTHLASDKHRDITWKELPGPDALARAIEDLVIEGFQDYLATGDPGEAFQRFDRFRILCGLREGPYGVVALNFLVEQILKEAGLIQPDKGWYRGRPVLITRNEYNLQLFNGDVGTVWPDSEANGELRVFFQAADRTMRKFNPARLPENETAYAMTVHKSQGSEFDKVLLILPDRDSPVLTRELVYTGITRARGRVEVWGTESVFRVAVRRQIERTSGLRDALWGF